MEETNEKFDLDDEYNNPKIVQDSFAPLTLLDLFALGALIGDWASCEKSPMVKFDLDMEIEEIFQNNSRRYYAQAVEMLKTRKEVLK